MKLIVKNVFRDKEDHVTVYEPGTVLDVNDKKRASDLVKRGLCAEYKGDEPVSVILGKESSAVENPEAPAVEIPASPAETLSSVPAKSDESKAKSDKPKAKTSKGKKQ